MCVYEEMGRGRVNAFDVTVMRTVLLVLNRDEGREGVVLERVSTRETE